MPAGPPNLIRPMLATLGMPPSGPGWAWEWKWDGVRAVAYLDGRGGLRLLTRNDRDVRASYPDLGPLAAASPAMVLDGEIVALDERGVPSFSRLQNRMHVRTPTPALLRAVPVRYYVFDLLWLAGQKLVARPYAERRARLDERGLPEPTEVSPAFTGDGVRPDDLLAAAAENGLEGVIAKRLASPYRPGSRSPDWVKVPLDRTQEVVIVGWKPGGGRRAGMIGSLLLAAHDEQGRLKYVGHVGTGFTQQMLRDLAARLAPLERRTWPTADPVPREHARDARWVEPVLVGEVQYRTWSLERPEQSRLRHPSWRGLRPDKDPGTVKVIRPL